MPTLIVFFFNFVVSQNFGSVFGERVNQFRAAGQSSDIVRIVK